MKANRPNLLRESFLAYSEACPLNDPHATHFGSFLAGMASGLRMANEHGIEEVIEWIKEELDESDDSGSGT